jgi:hypothetical protein
VAIAAAAWLPTASSTRERAPTVVDVSAFDAKGVPVGNLAAADVEVLVDGIAVPVTSVSRAAATLQTVLVVDATSSQPLRRSEMITAIGTHWLGSLVSGDRARLGMVANPIVFSGWLPSGQPAADAALPKGLLDRASQQPSPLWDAIDAAAQVIADEVSPGLPPGLKPRGSIKVVLVLSDGRATGNALGLEELAARAAALDVSISSVSEADEKRVAQGPDPVARIRPDASLEWLAAETGGVYLEDGIARRTIQPRLDRDPFGYVKELMNTPNQPGQLLARIIGVMRQRYYVSFAGSSEKGTHRLEVRSRAPDVAISAKRSYVVR